YTRDLSTAVWMGYPRGEIPMLSVHGQEVAGATFPVPMWHLYMAAAEWRLPVRQFLTPKAMPVFRPFQRGSYGYASSYYMPTTTPTTTAAPATTAAAAAPAAPAAPEVAKPKTLTSAPTPAAPPPPKPKPVAPAAATPAPPAPAPVVTSPPPAPTPAPAPP